MKKSLPITLIVTAVIVVAVFLLTKQQVAAPTQNVNEAAPKSVVNETPDTNTVNQTQLDEQGAQVVNEAKIPDPFSLVPPMNNADKRVTKKPFGIHITTATSPVQPERFAGYHTAVDFEMLSEDEYDADTPINVICDGALVRKQTASGYGGYAVQRCTINGGDVMVIYGHLDILRITDEVDLAPGDFLGYLGAHESTQTDGERKHLHLGIHKGTEINIKGYVSTESQLDGWLDPCEYVC